MKFEYKRKVFGYECDIYGHLNNANYFHIYEEARSEALAQTEYSVKKFNELGISLFVVHIELDYKKAVNFEENITVVSEITSVNRVKSTWSQSIFNSKNELCNTIYLEAVFGKNAKATRIDPKIVYHLQNFTNI